jgi:hypothetical protein
VANKRHKPEEIVTKLRQVDVLAGQGMARVDAIREVRITEQTYYRWRNQYGGMGTDQLRELKRLQKETERLRIITASFLAVATVASLKPFLPLNGTAQDRNAIGSEPPLPSFVLRSSTHRVERMRISESFEIARA